MVRQNWGSSGTQSRTRSLVFLQNNAENPCSHKWVDGKSTMPSRGHHTESVRRGHLRRELGQEKLFKRVMENGGVAHRLRQVLLTCTASAIGILHLHDGRISEQMSIFRTGIQVSLEIRLALTTGTCVCKVAHVSCHSFFINNRCVEVIRHVEVFIFDVVPLNSSFTIYNRTLSQPASILCLVL